ncbi:MAG: hypothetical protein HY348_07560 [Nitrospira defluvii]|nr:hypothetical protein [Nitrospira defluvii]
MTHEKYETSGRRPWVPAIVTPGKSDHMAHRRLNPHALRQASTLGMSCNALTDEKKRGAGSINRVQPDNHDTNVG